MVSSNTDPKSAWNDVSARAWVDAQPLLDHMYEPFERDLAAMVAPSCRAVLDVGCGAGATTLAIARSTSSACVGVDVSAPMIEAARARARREESRASFLCSNAETYAFEPATYDMIISRFGVMFFDDNVRAFANLRRAARSRGELVAFVWRRPDDNPFMTTAERAAAPLLPSMPARPENAPGAFAFADKDRVRELLIQAGWDEVQIDAVDTACNFPLEGLTQVFTRLGPLGQAMSRLDAPTRARVVEQVRPAFDPFIVGEEVRFNAACWLVRATA